MKDSRQVKASSLKKLKRLTPRQTEVLEQIARGRTTKQIAEGLYIQESTVKSHKKSIRKKLQLNGRNALLIWATENKDLLV